MSRGWTANEDDPRWKDEDYYDKVKTELDMLAQAWSRINEASEQEGWQRQADFENGFQDYDMDEEEEAMREAQRRLNNRLERAQVEVIEDRMAELGARMMRPYEHWNEDERYMEYMENRGY